MCKTRSSVVFSNCRFLTGAAVFLSDVRRERTVKQIREKNLRGSNPPIDNHRYYYTLNQTCLKSGNYMCSEKNVKFVLIFQIFAYTVKRLLFLIRFAG